MCVAVNMVCLKCQHFFFPFLYCKYNRPAVQSSIRMADDVDYEAQFKKLQSEAEDRLEEKVEDLMKNIETVGQN